MADAQPLGASHLLIKFSGSRNPISRRTNASTANVSYEAALTELQAWQAKIQSGEISFGDAAYQRSDCGSFARHGDLGIFTHGQMMAPFEDATRALKVGEMSGVVQTDSGLHLILRTA